MYQGFFKRAINLKNKIRFYIHTALQNLSIYIKYILKYIKYIFKYHFSSIRK